MEGEVISPYLPHGFHSHHTQPICSPHAARTSLKAHTWPPHHHHAPLDSPTNFTATTHNPYAVHIHPMATMATTIHLQLTHNHPSPPCSRPQPHAHPHDFTSTMQPWSFTKPTQLTHVATPHHNSLTLPTQLTHAAHNSPMHTSPTCSPYTSQLTHGLLTTTMHSRPPLRSPYNWSLAAEFFLWRIVKFVVVSKWNSNGKDVNS